MADTPAHKPIMDWPVDFAQMKCLAPVRIVWFRNHKQRTREVCNEPVMPGRSLAELHENIRAHAVQRHQWKDGNCMIDVVHEGETDG